MFHPAVRRGGSLFSAFALRPNKSHRLHNHHNNLQFTNNFMKNKSFSNQTCPEELKSPESKFDEDDDKYSKEGLRRDKMPRHAATSLDGNRRWFKAHNRDVSYKPFFDKKMLVAKLCIKWGIPTATSLVWGSGNFTKRGKAANDMFFGQFEEFFEENIETFMRKGIKVLVKGNISAVPNSLQATISRAEEATKDNSNLKLYLPVCYTGQWDITEATRKICEKVKAGAIEPQDVNEDMIENEFTLPSSPPIDFFFRTGGEARVGALLAWQVCHTELYFTDILAPDFGEVDFLDAMRAYQKARRLFSA